MSVAITRALIAKMYYPEINAFLLPIRSKDGGLHMQLLWTREDEKGERVIYRTKYKGDTTRVILDEQFSPEFPVDIEEQQWMFQHMQADAKKLLSLNK